jgi:hypothetical protein
MIHKIINPGPIEGWIYRVVILYILIAFAISFAFLVNGDFESGIGTDADNWNEVPQVNDNDSETVAGMANFQPPEHDGCKFNGCMGTGRNEWRLPASLIDANNGTFEYWVWHEVLNSTNTSRVFASQDTRGNNYEVRTHYNTISGDGFEFYFGDTGGTVRHIDIGTASVGAKTHIAVTWNKSGSTTTFKSYKNGVYNSSDDISFTGTLNIPNQYWTIGLWHNDPPPSEPFINGIYDEFRLWSTARSATEIADNYQSECVGNEAGLIACYKFDSNLEDIHYGILDSVYRQGTSIRVSGANCAGGSGNCMQTIDGFDSDTYSMIGRELINATASVRSNSASSAAELRIVDASNGRILCKTTNSSFGPGTVTLTINNCNYSRVNNIKIRGVSPNADTLFFDNMTLTEASKNRPVVKIGEGQLFASGMGCHTEQYIDNRFKVVESSVIWEQCPDTAGGTRGIAPISNSATSFVQIYDTTLIGDVSMRVGWARTSSGAGPTYTYRLKWQDKNNYREIAFVCTASCSSATATYRVEYKKIVNGSTQSSSNSSTFSINVTDSSNLNVFKLLVARTTPTNVNVRVWSDAGTSLINVNDTTDPLWNSGYLMYNTNNNTGLFADVQVAQGNNITVNGLAAANRALLCSSTDTLVASAVPDGTGIAVIDGGSANWSYDGSVNVTSSGTSCTVNVLGSIRSYNISGGDVYSFRGTELLTHGPLITLATPTSGKIWIRASGAGNYKIGYKLFSDPWPGSPCTGTETCTAATPLGAGRDFTGIVALSGLTADTQYAYRVYINDVLQTGGEARFKTFLAEGTDGIIKIASSSCLAERYPYDIFDAIAAQNPTMFILQGDNIYEDHPQWSPIAKRTAQWRIKHRDARQDIRYTVFQKEFPSYFQADDHEYQNDSTWNNGDTEEDCCTPTKLDPRFFIEGGLEYDNYQMVGNPDPPYANARYFKARAGNVEVFFIELIRFRDRLEAADSISVQTSGTVSTTNGSKIVTISTSWDSTVRYGSIIRINASTGTRWYNVQSRDSSTQITLQEDYIGPTESGRSIRVIKDLKKQMDLKQMAWLLNSMRDSTATTKIIASSKNLKYSRNWDTWAFNTSALDGFVLQRDEIRNDLNSYVTGPFVWVVGDSHVSYVVKHVDIMTTKDEWEVQASGLGPPSYPDPIYKPYISWPTSFPDVVGASSDDPVFSLVTIDTNQTPDKVTIEVFDRFGKRVIGPCTKDAAGTAVCENTVEESTADAFRITAHNNASIVRDDSGYCFALYRSASNVAKVSMSEDTNCLFQSKPTKTVTWTAVFPDDNTSGPAMTISPGADTLFVTYMINPGVTGIGARQFVRPITFTTSPRNMTLGTASAVGPARMARDFVTTGTVGAWSIDEGSGNPVDASSCAQNAAIQNQAVHSSAVTPPYGSTSMRTNVDNAYNDYLLVTRVACNSIASSSFAVDGWIRLANSLPSVNGHHGVLFANRDGGGGTGRILLFARWNTATGCVANQLATFIGGLNTCGGSAFVLNTWYHVGFNYTHTSATNCNIKLYINGSQVANVNRTANCMDGSTGSYHIGNEKSGTANGLEGYIQNVHLATCAGAGCVARDANYFLERYITGNSAPQIARDTNGKLWVTARTKNGNSQDSIRTRQSTNSDSVSAWEAEVIHDDGDTGIKVPCMTNLGAGKIFLGWHCSSGTCNASGGQVYYNYYDGAAWQFSNNNAGVVSSASHQTGTAYYCSVASDKNGSALIVYQKSGFPQTPVFRILDNGNWASAENVLPSDFLYGSLSASFSNDRYYIVGAESVQPNTTNVGGRLAMWRSTTPLPITPGDFIKNAITVPDKGTVRYVKMNVEPTGNTIQIALENVISGLNAPITNGVKVSLYSLPALGIVDLPHNFNDPFNKNLPGRFVDDFKKGTINATPVSVLD